MLYRQLKDALVKGLNEGDGKDGEAREQHESTKTLSPSKARSLSDVGLPALSPDPSIKESDKPVWRDDSAIDDNLIVPKRSGFLQRGLSLMMPRELKPPNDLIPVSPKLDKFTANMLPRRSRGMDFSRAATNLHHSILAEQSSPDSSPTTSSRAMNIPNKTNGFNSYGSGEFFNNPTLLWSTTGSSDQMNLSSSLGSINTIIGSDSSESCSDEDDLMDDIDDSIIMTPQVKAFGGLHQDIWPGQSFGTRSPMNFQRSSLRNSNRKKSWSRGEWNMNLSPSSKSSTRIRSHDGVQGWDKSLDIKHARRDSISWTANQLHISGNENMDGPSKQTLESVDSAPITPCRDGQRGVIRRPVTRRGNMLPKTKGFARIQAALAEESAPVETEVRREGEVVRQTRESDIDLEPRQSFVNLPSSPILAPSAQDAVAGFEEDEKSLDSFISRSRLKIQASLNSESKGLWETFSDENTHQNSQLPSNFHRTSITSMSAEMSLDFPISCTAPSLPQETNGHQSSSTSRSGTPQPSTGIVSSEMTQKLTKKRLREDDFDLTSFKRRAVSPGLSAHNSPIAQSPLQRDHPAWGSRPPSSCNIGEVGKSATNAFQKRIGFQGMMDTNDGLMKMSIE